MELTISNDSFLRLIKEAVREVIDEKLSPGKKYLTRRDVADRCNVSIMTVDNWCAKRMLNPQKIGRRVLFLADDIDEAVANGKIIRYQHLLKEESKH